eukprot:scaffold134793_cov46-Prasinocladus_malaysianus.AAC.2
MVLPINRRQAWPRPASVVSHARHAVQQQPLRVQQRRPSDDQQLSAAPVPVWAQPTSLAGPVTHGRCLRGPAGARDGHGVVAWGRVVRAQRQPGVRHPQAADAGRVRGRTGQDDGRAAGARPGPATARKLIDRRPASRPRSLTEGRSATHCHISPAALRNFRGF